MNQTTIQNQKQSLKIKTLHTKSISYQKKEKKENINTYTLKLIIQ